MPAAESPGGPVVMLAGPTAIGKTALALALAEEIGGEIIGADSTQVYRYLDIGSAKPTPEERRRVPHHLIDYVEPDTEYNAGIFVRDCRQAVAGIHARSRIPIITGGTGLYFTSYIEGIFEMPPVPDVLRQEIRKQVLADRAAMYDHLLTVDPGAAARVHINDTQRLTRALEIHAVCGRPWSELVAEHGLSRRQNRERLRPRMLYIGLERPRSELYARIDRRCLQMVADGLLDEVRSLLDRGLAPELPAMRSLGYRHMIQVVNGALGLDEAIELMARDTRRYAKRQMTWFRGDPDIEWHEVTQEQTIIDRVVDFIRRRADAGAGR